MSDIVDSANINYAYSGKFCSSSLMVYETDPTIANKTIIICLGLSQIKEKCNLQLVRHFEFNCFIITDDNSS